MKNPLLDKNFLKELDLNIQKNIYAKVIALTNEEEPVEEITGRITQGSITVDGKSAVRRTCSLTLVTVGAIEYNNYLWGLNTRINIQIGVENTINKEYPNIIWFPQGIFLITNFSVSVNTNSFTFSIQGKDKMALLNGDISGNIYEPVDFSKVDTYDKIGDKTERVDLSLQEIIIGLIHTWGQEKLSNIYINDMPEFGRELLANNSLVPYYYLVDAETNEVRYIGTDKTTHICKNKNSENLPDIKFEDLTNEDFDKSIYNEIFQVGKIFIADEVTKELGFAIDEEFKVVKISPQQSCAYRKCKLKYSGDLIANAGETITSVLDKIVKQLGNYEYFYDLDGKFIFQEKKNYRYNSFSTLVQQNNTEDEEDIQLYTEDAMNLSAYSYSFDNQKLINSFNLNPNLNNIKNDFSIWGERNSVVSSAKIPIYLRYAIDEKPTLYVSYDKPYIYVSGDEYSTKEAKNYPGYPQEYTDFIKVNITESFFNTYKNGYVAPGTTRKLVLALYKKEKLGHYTLIENQSYENDAEYYIQISSGEYSVITCDWREIIYQMALDYQNHHLEELFSINLQEKNTINDIIYYPKGKTGYEQYYIDILGNWRDLYNPEVDEDKNKYYEPISNSEIICIKEANKEEYKYADKLIYSDTEILDVTDNYESKKYSDIEYDEIYQYNSEDQSFTCPKESISLRDLCYYLSSVLNDGILGTDNQYQLIYKNGNKNSVIEEGWEDGAFYLDGSLIDDNMKLKKENFYYEPPLNGPTDETKPMKEVKAFEYYYKNVSLPNPEYSEHNKYYSIKKSSSKKFKIQNNGLYNILCSITQIEPNNQYYKFDNNYKIRRHTTTGSVPHYDEFNIGYYIERYEYEPQTKWYSGIFQSPETLNFWFDFLDTSGELGQYSVKAIGPRPKIVNDNTVKAISYKEIFNVEIVEEQAGFKNFVAIESQSLENPYASETGYNHFAIPTEDEQEMFKTSSIGKSAIDVLDSYLNQFTHGAETISINCVPIYYLTPNTLITIQNDEMGLKASYELTNFNLSLSHNGSMTISATRVLNSLY